MAHQFSTDLSLSLEDPCEILERSPQARHLYEAIREHGEEPVIEEAIRIVAGLDD